jgi:hypothetical protein
MKIGFSFGRCVASIVRGEVEFDDVLCIIARTRMSTEEHVRGVVRDYMGMPGYLLGLDQTACEDIGVRLFDAGKILEPRANGIRPMSVPRDYIWMDMFPTAPAGVASDAVKMAWEHYRLLITLTEQLPEEGFVPEHSERAKPLTPEEEETNRKMLDMLINSI